MRVLVVLGLAGFGASGVLASLSAGCANRDVARLASVKDEVCACKDVACAETALKTVPHGDVKATHKEQEIARDMLDCLAKLYEQAPGGSNAVPAAQPD